MLDFDQVNNKKIALLWGRNFFYHLSFPLTLCLSLIYLFPVGMGGEAILFWLFQLIVVIGLFNIFMYYFIFLPLVRLSSGFYSSRIFALLIFLVLVLSLVVDAFFLLETDQHVSFSLLGKWFQEKGYLKLSLVNQTIWAIGLPLISLLIFFWAHSGRVWERMKKTFSPPRPFKMSVFIFLSLLISHLLFYFYPIDTSIFFHYPFQIGLYLSQSLRFL